MEDRRSNLRPCLSIVRPLSSIPNPLYFFVWLLLWLPAGCAGSRFQHFDQALLAENGTMQRDQGVVENYTVACPDVVEWKVDGDGGLSGRQTIEPDGRIDLGPMGRLRIEGRTVPQVTGRLAELFNLPPDKVQVRVAEFNSRQIYLFGQVLGRQRAVPYRGQETVLDLLQRAGGITVGAEENKVYVVRPHVVDGSSPELFHVDLRAIVLDHNSNTNIRLQPFDQVYVGETRVSCLEKCIPPILRPLYETVCGMRRGGHEQPTLPRSRYVALQPPTNPHETK